MSKVWFITGASKGFGREWAEAALERGDSVAGTARKLEAVDALVKEQAAMPMGVFQVADMSGLDTVLKVARDMRDAYGDRFYVHKGMEALVEGGDLGAKSGKGFYEH